MTNIISDNGPASSELNNLIVWVWFPQVAIEYFDSKFLNNLGRRIGKVIKVNTTTKMATRGKYARVCVEIDLSQPLLSRFKIKGKVFRVLYKSLHLLCYGCGRYGHIRENCKQAQVQQQRDDQEPRSENPQGNDVDHLYGPWMVVQKQRFKRSIRPQGEETMATKKPMVNNEKGELPGNRPTRKEVRESSRFAVLQEEQMNQEMVDGDIMGHNDTEEPSAKP